MRDPSTSGNDVPSMFDGWFRRLVSTVGFDGWFRVDGTVVFQRGVSRLMSECSEPCDLHVELPPHTSRRVSGFSVAHVGRPSGVFTGLHASAPFSVLFHVQCGMRWFLCCIPHIDGYCQSRMLVSPVALSGMPVNHLVALVFHAVPCLRGSDGPQAHT
jgi:hypothetical protein